MLSGEESVARTVVLSADREPFPVVFEMLAEAVIVEPYESLHLVMTGPEDAKLTVGYGQNGVSVFRDTNLKVEVFDHRGERLTIAGW